MQIDGLDRELSVSSKILSVASDALKSMFKSHFAEGKQLQCDLAPTRLPLPDDDGAALTPICQVVHFRAGEAPPSLTADDLVRIGVVCDKYDFTEAL